jgi:hypothetical protein
VLLAFIASAAAAVRPHDHFEVVAVRVAEIDAAPAVAMVDLAGPATSDQLSIR